MLFLFTFRENDECSVSWFCNWGVLWALHLEHGLVPLAGTDILKLLMWWFVNSLFLQDNITVLYFMCYVCLYIQVLNKSIEYRNFFNQRRRHQLEPDLSEEVSARLRLGSGSNGLFRRKMSTLDTKEKSCSGKERDKRTDDLLELTEVLFLVLLRIRDMFLNNSSYSRLEWLFWRVSPGYEYIYERNPAYRLFSHWLRGSLVICEGGLRDHISV